MSEQSGANVLHIDDEFGLWIPPEYRDFTAQIVIRTPRGTIQHFQSGGGKLDPYYGMVDSDDFGQADSFKFDSAKNPELCPNRVSIKKQGEDPVVFEVENV